MQFFVCETFNFTLVITNRAVDRVASFVFGNVDGRAKPLRPRDIEADIQGATTGLMTLIRLPFPLGLYG